MNTQMSFRLFTGIVVAAVAVTAAAVSPARANSVQTDSLGLTVVTPHQGPGVGSVKAPPFYDAAYVGYINARRAAAKDLHFHSTVDSVRTPSQQRQGPGVWSSKAPGVR